MKQIIKRGDNSDLRPEEGQTDSTGLGTGVSVKKGDVLKITATGTWGNQADQNCDPDGNPDPHHEPGLLLGRPVSALVGHIGTSGDWFFIGSSLPEKVADESGQLFVSMNDKPDMFGNNHGFVSINIEKKNPNSGDSDCPICHVGETIVPGSNPLSTRMGEKREYVTDIRLNSPAGALELSRVYRQGKQEDFQFMGMGWTHNHALSLAEQATAQGTTIKVKLPKGGQSTYMYELTDTDGDHYQGVSGMTSSVLKSSTGSYILTASDQSNYTFDSTGKLLTHSWSAGEATTYTWTYSYNGAGQLTEIDDGFGRKLVFRYYAGGAYDGLLYRVGDHTFVDTDPAHPTGRFVEYSYVPNKIINAQQQIIDGQSALLVGVKDTLGQVWSYNYYGQHDGETDPTQLNFLTQAQSPLMDLTGSGVSGGMVALEKVDYTLQEGSISEVTQQRGLSGTELLVNGGMEVDDAWANISGASPTTNERSSVLVDSGAFSRHVVCSAAGQGIESQSWDLQAYKTYLVMARIFPVSGTVKMSVSGESAFDRNTKQLGAWNTLLVLYTPTTDGVGRKLRFVAREGAAEFYVDTVTVTETAFHALLKSTYAYGQEVTTETRAGKTATLLFSDEVFVGTQDPAGNSSQQSLDHQFRPEVQTDGNGYQTSLAWSDDGVRLEEVVDALGYATQFDYNLDAPKLNTLNYSLDPEGRKTQYLYNDPHTSRLPSDIKVMDVDGSTVLRWQKFSYDTKGRTEREAVVDPTDENTEQQATERTYYEEGNGYGLLERVTQIDLLNPANDVTTTYSYDSAGRVIQTASSRTFGNCLRSFTVYDAAGNGVASICNYDPDSSPDPETAAEAVALFDESRPEWNRVIVHEYDSLGRRFKTTTDAGASYAQTTLTVYDALNRVVRTLRHYVADAAVPHPFIAARESFNPGPDQTWNQITDTTYNARGMVRRTVDVLGNATLYGYDAAGRLVKTISSASLPDYPNEYLQNESEEWIGDPELKDYPLSDAPDLDLVSLSEYDAAGNLVKSVNPLGQVTFTVYDALNRPLKTVRYAKAEATVALNVGDAGYNPAHDPRSEAYQPSEQSDRDHIDLTIYDRMGRVVRSRDALGVWTLFGYDALGRQVKVIRSASQPTYDLDADPDLSAYLPEDAPDQDLVTETGYDPQGRVMYAQEALGRRTWSAYDGLGRTTRTVHNAVGSATDGGAHDPRSPYYHPVLNLSDRDQIALTEYDLNGRVLWTQDYLGRRTWMAYDGLGRTVRTITHAVGTATDGSPSDPRSPVYLTSAEPDRDLVSHTRYDSQGRVAATVDTLGNETRYTYDVLGRRITTITNFVTGSYEPQHPDRDLLSQTVYDRASRVTETIDPRGTRTTFTFDRTGRRVSATTAAGTALATTDYTCYNRGGQVQRIIRNYRPGPTDPPPDALEEPREGWSHTFDFTRSAQPWVSNYWGSYEPGTGFRTENKSDSYGTYEAVDPVITFPQAVTLTRIEMHFTVTGRGGSPYGNDGDYFYADCNRPGGCPPAFPHLAFWHLLGDSVSPRVWTGRTVLRSLRLQLLTTALQNPSLHHGVVSKVVLEGVGDDPFKTTPRYLFSPEWHGQNADQNLITTFGYDSAGRQIEVTDPAGGKTLMSYDKGGRLLTQTDPLGNITVYRYDRLGRRVLVVQNWAAAGLSDPAEWHWDGTHWVDGKGTVVAHGERNDRNLPVQVEYDKGGRMLTLRDPRGNRSTYTYDLLDRRRSLTDPLNQCWETAYFNLNGTTRTEHTNPLQQVTRHDTDEAGRLKRVEYLDESPKLTPDVFFRYDKGGRRVAMAESLDLGSTWVRRTQFSHDLAGRLNQVTFDTDGDGTPEQTVSYRYEAGGLRTQLILPEGQTVTYQYDVRGQLVGVTDWEDNVTAFRFDQVGRLVQSQRANGFASQYAYDVGGRLVRLSHTRDGQSLGHFEYTVDGRGNRTQALECLPRVGSGSTTYSYDSAALHYPVGVWTDNTPYKQTVSRIAVMQLSFLAREATLTLGQGPDHGLADIYLDGTFWQSHNLYAATPGDLTLMLAFTADGPHHLELRNRADKDPRSTGYKLAFKALVTAATSSLYDLHTLTYHYDALSRLVNASYHPGTNPTGTAFREYAYQYDGAGNRTRETVTVEGVPTISNWTYNGVNQISSGGVTYDGAGRMTSDGTNPYTWDRADRLRSHNTISYQYNGLGQRVGQSGMNSTTQYLLDLQPGLFQLLASTHQVWAQPAVTTRYLHALKGIHQQQNDDESWVYPVQDGLGSVRAVVDAAGQILESRLYAPYGDPYGDPFGGSGTAQTGFGFTGEVTDASGLVYLRARYYVPELGVFPSLDPVEGALDHPPSLNRYGYVQQNPVNWTDPSGTCPEEVRAAGRAVAELVELAPGVDLGPDGELVFENAACAAYYGFAQVPLQVIDKARDIAKAAPILYGAKAAYEAARLATAAVGASTLVLGGAVVAIPVLMLIIAGGASIPSPYTEEMLETMRNRYPRLNNQHQSWSASEDVPHPQPQPLRAPQPPDQGNCSNNSDQDRERHYYFRGTSVGYPGNESLQQLRITPVSTQPGVATAFAVESKRFGEGIVYIASKHDLTGILITPGSVLAQLEHEMAVHLLPLEFAARASVNTSPEASRKILASMGVHIPATIYSKSDISSILAQNRVLTDAEITIFVGRVRLEGEQ